jgi:hypothetical protein
MKRGADESHRAAFFIRPSGTTNLARDPNPAINRWAILNRPSGTGFHMNAGLDASATPLNIARLADAS